MAEHIVSTQEADATIVLDTHYGKYYTLNGVAGRIWTLLSARANFDDIVERLAPEYEVSVEQLSSDVDNFLDELQRLKLITQ